MHSRRRTLNPSVKPSSAIKNNHDHEGKSLPHALRIFAATLAVTHSLLVSTTTFAQETSHALPTDNAIHSSTVTLSEIIKTMDFSLPSSYDSIPDPITSGREEESRKAKGCRKQGHHPPKFWRWRWRRETLNQQRCIQAQVGRRKGRLHGRTRSGSRTSQGRCCGSCCAER